VGLIRLFSPIKSTLILSCSCCPQGRLIVRAGSEGFQSEMGPWSFLGSKALVGETYVPDFDACAPGGCRLLRIHADAYRAALRMGKAEKIVGARAMRQVCWGGVPDP
jgi:metal transporter CNNM